MSDESTMPTLAEKVELSPAENAEKDEGNG